MASFDKLEEELSQLTLLAVKDERFIVAHYYVKAADDIRKVAEKVASHQSTAAGVFAEDTLVNRCSAMVTHVKYWDQSRTKGYIGIAFPLELFGSNITSSDILHIVSGAVQNDEAHHQVFYLLDVELPPALINTFPGPTHGPSLFTEKDIKVGTILKPCSGISLGDYERIINDLVQYKELVFIKEDENLFPEFTHCPLEQRVKIAARVIQQTGREIIFAPHLTAPPRKIFRNLEIVAQAGLKAVMFSETYYGGMFREAREYIQEKNLGLALYAHNGGICAKTKSINRVLLDRFARLDGADLRQTAPSGEGCYLRPLSWQRPQVEAALTETLGALRPTICVRAGGLDQGNLLLNLHECKNQPENYLFLMGSAINSIKNKTGSYDTIIAMTAIRDIISIFRTGKNIKSPSELYKFANMQGLSALRECLAQRYSPQQLSVQSTQEQVA